MALRLQAPRLDRIVRGRAWIPVLGATLLAIVGLRVEVLRLGSSVGTEVQRATVLQSSNTALRTQISALTDNQRIEKLAQRYGMHSPSPSDVKFLQSDVGNHVSAAIRNISAPSSSKFVSGLAAQEQANQQTDQAIAAQNGSATSNTAANSNATVSSTAGATQSGGTTSSTLTGTGGTSAVSSATSTGGTGAAAAGSTAAGGSTVTSTSSGSPPPASSATGATSSGSGSPAVNTGVASNVSSATASQSTAVTATTNGGGGLGG